jgi:hypothetical protein
MSLTVGPDTDIICHKVGLFERAAISPVERQQDNRQQFAAPRACKNEYVAIRPTYSSSDCEGSIVIELSPLSLREPKTVLLHLVTVQNTNDILSSFSVGCVVMKAYIKLVTLVKVISR